MPKNVEELRNQFKGRDIYVLGSGKSLDFIPDSFWKGKIVIGVNFVYEKVPCIYTVCHHYCVLQPIIDSGLTTVITSEIESCVWNSQIPGWVKPYPHHEALKGEYYWYHHNNQQYTEIDLSTFDNPGWITAGGSIITSAIHFAYLLGAANIILAGADGGKLDGEMNYAGYDRTTNDDHGTNIQKQHNQIVTFIRNRGIGVVSINPFFNFMNEGHTFTYFKYNQDGGGEFVKLEK